MKLTPLMLLGCSWLPLPQAFAQTATIRGGVSAAAAGQPILTREELRACLKQEEDIRSRLAQHEAARATLDKEREGIAASQEALRAERAQVDVVSAKAQAFKTKMDGYGARLAQWNRDVEDFNANPPPGPIGERARVRLNTERDALQTSQAELEGERQLIAADNERVVVAFNTKAREVEATVASWNQRNRAWNEASVKLEEERKGWVSSCSDRRYREIDEEAIKAGR